MSSHLPQTVIEWCPSVLELPWTRVCSCVTALSPLLSGSVCVHRLVAGRVSALSAHGCASRVSRRCLRARPGSGPPRQGAWLGGITKKCILLLLAETGSI